MASILTIEMGAPDTVGLIPLNHQNQKIRTKTIKQSAYQSITVLHFKI